MTLKKREKVLAVVAAFLVVLLAAQFLFSGPGGSIGDLRQERDEKAKQLGQRKKNVRRAQAAVEKLRAWERRALPSDLKLAKSLYQNWLRDLTVRAGFDEPVVDPGKATGSYYTAFPYTIRAKGDLRQLTRFLYGFYDAGHLHQIRSLRLKPLERSEKLDLVLTIEALSLPGADREKKLSDAPGARLKRNGLPAYEEVVVRRRLEGERFADSGGLFAAYYPEPPKVVAREPEPPPPPPPEFDHARFAKLQANVATDGRWEAWLTVQTTGRQWRLSEGDTFEIGTLQGKVTRVLPHAMEFEADGRRLLVTAGQSLRDAVEVP